MPVDIKDVEKLNRTDKLILDAMKGNPSTSFKISRKISREWQYVCQRLRVLADRGLVKKKKKVWISEVIL